MDENGQLARVVKPTRWARGAVASAYSVHDPRHHRVIEIGEIVLVTGTSSIGEKLVIYYEGTLYEIAGCNLSFL